MKSQTIETKLLTPFGEVDVTVKYHWENDGLGWYEFWGSKCFDAGQTYPEIEDITPEFLADDEQEFKDDVLKFIDDQFELCAERVSEKIYPESPEDDYEPDADYNVNVTDCLSINPAGEPC